MNRRVSGIVGILAAVVLFTGDMLLYGHWGGAAAIREGIGAVAPDASAARLFAGGILGPIGALLYIIGFFHVYQNTRQVWETAAKVVFGGCVAVMVIGGAYHALWTVRMLLYKYAVPDIPELRPFTEAIDAYANATYTISSIPGYLAFPILFLLVLSGGTRYPRWTAAVNPGLLILLGSLFSRFPAPLGAVIVGGYINLVYILFFTISVLTTWRGDPGDSLNSRRIDRSRHTEPTAEAGSHRS